MASHEEGDLHGDGACWRTYCQGPQAGDGQAIGMCPGDSVVRLKACMYLGQIYIIQGLPHGAISSKLSCLCLCAMSIVNTILRERVATCGTETYLNNA